MAVAGRLGSAGTAEGVDLGASGATLTSNGDRGQLLLPHVPRPAAEWAATGPGERPWRVVDGTLVFADISGFTALSERLARQGPIGAEELTEVLGHCFAELLAVAYARGGSLVKFGGDALLLLFDGDGHAVRAVDAALGMRSTMRRVGRLSTSVGSVRLRMSLGVHTGPVHLFLVGASHRELLLAGPGPSSVVTMEGTAEAGEVVVSPATATRIDASLLAGPKGPGVLLRPRIEPVPLLEVFSHPERTATGDVSSQVPHALREHLLDGGGESEHRHAAIAFVHFDGTDGLLAERGPAWVATALDVLVRDVQEACERHGATFLASDLDHDGGKLILVGGVPRTLGDDDGRVLRAVREIVDRALRRGDDGIPVRVGINRGPVFAGEVGPPYRRTFTVMGDAVNLAARLMAKAARGEVLASASVLERSRTAFSVTELAPFFVKGKSRPVRAYAVGATQGATEARRASRLAFAGREEELGTLLEAWRSAEAGRGRAVVVTGDVGVGKTRLLDELRQCLGAGDVRTVQCEQYEDRTPYFAFRVLLRTLLGLPAGATVSTLTEAVTGVAADLEPWVPLIGDVVNITCADSPNTASLEPQFRGLRTRDVVERLLDALVTEPTVLAFDDAQWLDQASAVLLERLVASVGGRPWLVCATRRRGVDDPLAAFDGAGEGGRSGDVVLIRLDPLPEATCRALVRGVRREAPLPPHRLDAARRASRREPTVPRRAPRRRRHRSRRRPARVTRGGGLRPDRPPAD